MARAADLNQRVVESIRSDSIGLEMDCRGVAGIFSKEQALK